MKRILEIGPHFYVTDGKRTFQVATKQLALDICKSEKDIEEAYRETASPAYREGDYVLTYADNSLRKVHRVMMGPLGWAYMLGGEDGPYFDNELYKCQYQPSNLRKVRSVTDAFDKIYVSSNTFDSIAVHCVGVPQIVREFLEEAGYSYDLINQFCVYAELRAAEMFTSAQNRVEVYVREGEYTVLDRPYVGWGGYFQLHAPKNVLVTNAWAVSCAGKKYTFFTKKPEDAIFFGTWQEAVEFISAINGGAHE